MGDELLGDKDMNEHRRQILQMLSEGKISADEAERLISAFEEPAATNSPAESPTGKSRPKYLRVQVDSEGDAGEEGPTKVNVPLTLTFVPASF